MKSIYMTALSPLKGADGDLKRFQLSCTEEFGWHSPLPLMVPLALWSASFPRDRVNTKGLRSLPPLKLSGPVIKKDHIILQMKDAGVFDNELMFREIHGKNIPPLENNSFINWEGLLLHPSGIKNNSVIEENSFQFRSWQLGLYKLRYDERRNWWEDFSCSCLWKVRKPL
jgi:hypothetical protein